MLPWTRKPAGPKYRHSDAEVTRRRNEGEISRKREAARWRAAMLAQVAALRTGGHVDAARDLQAAIDAM